jgi:2-oxoglutarate ferredoxin oxidoreductase subunit beta
MHKGFSVVEILSQCPTYFGRKNKVGGAVDMLEYFKDQTTPIGSKAKAENPELIERGIFVQEERPEYCSEYGKIIDRARKGR